MMEAGSPAPIADQLSLGVLTRTSTNGLGMHDDGWLRLKKAHEVSRGRI